MKRTRTQKNNASRHVFPPTYSTLFMGTWLAWPASSAAITHGTGAQVGPAGRGDNTPVKLSMDSTAGSGKLARPAAWPGWPGWPPPGGHQGATSGSPIARHAPRPISNPGYPDCLPLRPTPPKRDQEWRATHAMSDWGSGSGQHTHSGQRVQRPTASSVTRSACSQRARSVPSGRPAGQQPHCTAYATPVPVPVTVGASRGDSLKILTKQRKSRLSLTDVRCC